MFEFEKKRIKEMLFENPYVDMQQYYKKKLDELYKLSSDCLCTKLSYITGTTMLLPVYLGCKHVHYWILVLNSVLDEVILDPVYLNYRSYSRKYRELADVFYAAPSDEVPIYNDELLGDRFDFPKYFGLQLNEMFQSFVPDGQEFNEQIRPDNELGTIEQSVNVLINNTPYLTKKIRWLLANIACELDDIDNKLSYRLDEPLTGLFEKRCKDYINSSYGIDARYELYNDIKILSGVIDEKQVLKTIMVQVSYRLKCNRIGTLYLRSKRVDLFIYDLDDSVQRPTQVELNDFFKLHSQYELISKLVDYSCQWAVNDKKSLFVNEGTSYIINTLVPYIAKKIKFRSRKSYAALWRALIDLNLLDKTDAESFKDWVNSGLLKDAPDDSSRGGKIKTDKSIREAVDDMFKFQTKEGKQKLFKDLTEKEISQLKNGENLKELYRDSILILATAFDLELKKENFQSYISEYPHAKEYLSDFPKDKKSRYVLECFRAYEDFVRH